MERKEFEENLIKMEEEEPSTPYTNEAGDYKVPKDLRRIYRSPRVMSEKEQERVLGAMYQLGNAQRLEKIQQASDIPERENHDSKWQAARMSVPFVPFPHSLEDLGTARGVPNSHEGIVELMEEFAVKKRMNLPIAENIFN